MDYDYDKRPVMKGNFFAYRRLTHFYERNELRSLGAAESRRWIIANYKSLQ